MNHAQIINTGNRGQDFTVHFVGGGSITKAMSLQYAARLWTALVICRTGRFSDSPMFAIETDAANKESSQRAGVLAAKSLPGSRPANLQWSSEASEQSLCLRRRPATTNGTRNVFDTARRARDQ